jgi:uncharacterized protein YecE (DUF72 family)
MTSKNCGKDKLRGKNKGLLLGERKKTMKNLPANIKIGTCSWKYDSWKGLVYSDHVGKNFQEQLQEFCQNLPSKFHYCIEIRNQNYLNNRYFEFLEATRLSHVFLQGYWMPSIFQIYGHFKKYIKNHTVIRLHGPDRKGIEQQTQNQWNAIVDPKDGELHNLRNMVNSLLASEVKVTLNINNHYEGSAPMTIERFVKLFLGDIF